MPKKISGEYFRENREFVPIGRKVRDCISGSIEKKRLDTARKFAELFKNQRESRARIFKAYGIDMPLPDISESQYLERHVPADAWLYVQYGAILFPQEDGSVKISSDGALLITDLEVKGRTIADINGIPTRKEDVEGKEGAGEDIWKSSPTERKDPCGKDGNREKGAPESPPAEHRAMPLTAEKKDGNRPGYDSGKVIDILAADRERARRKMRRKKTEKILRISVTATVVILAVLIMFTAVYRYI